MDTVKHYSDEVNPLERGGEFLIAVMLALLTGFFIIHQTTDTGFFTEKFGVFEAILLYTPILLAFIDSVTQIVTGQHNPARPFEAASALLLGLSAVWFLIVFPFDFTHLADALPQGLRFPLRWVTDDIGRIPLIFQAIASPIAAFAAIRKYFAVL
jgi:hypothetical protein